MIKVGITGNIGSGKTSVENILIKMGFKTLCADKISHDIFDNDDNTRRQIFKIFKTNERQIIANIIFKDKKKKEELEGILHPIIKRRIEDEISKCKDKIIFVSIPLLFEASFEKMFDKIILISANEDIRLNRIMKRNGYDKEHALLRIKSQMTEEEKMPMCDFVLKNEGSLEDLEKNLEEILKNLLV